MKYLYKKKNVNGFGRGFLVRNGRIIGRGFVVTVTKKVPVHLLKEEDLIPREIGGIETDVLEVGDLKFLDMDRTQRYRPFPMGVSCGNVQITAGTAGFLAVDTLTGKKVLVSNNHVLANVNNAPIGSSIVQPGVYDGGVEDNDTVAHLTRFVKIESSDCKTSKIITSILNLFMSLIKSRFRFSYSLSNPSGNIPSNKVDCACATLIDPNIAIKRLAELAVPDTVSNVKLGDTVLKSGRSTGVTEGVVHAIDYEANVQMDKEGTKTAHFVDQILVNHNISKFSAPGDSGSAIINRNESLVGLLFAGSDQVTICNKIQNVFEELKVRLYIV